jgi:heat shock 70kDa protein 4
MRMVVKNKEEGTELFKGGNIRPAAARYQKALSHAGDFSSSPPSLTL